MADRIKTALERGSQYTLEAILWRLVEGSLQLWTYGNQAVLVTSLIDDYCLLLCCSGDNMTKWLHCLERIEGWAKSEGCESMRIHGRRGWSRVLGYKIEGIDEIGLTIMGKAL